MGKPRTLSLFARKKRRGEKIVVLTAYDLTSARIAARGGVDALLGEKAARGGMETDEWEVRS